MKTIIILILVTICYAGYNLLIKVSMSHVESATIPPIIATICLQATALFVSVIYLLSLSRQLSSLVLPSRAYLWAVGAGLCIGIAEILYFYLFRGFENETRITASSAIPFVVGGTIIIAAVTSCFVFRDVLNTGQWAGLGLSIAGITVLAINSL